MSFPNRVLVAKHGLHQRGCGARVIARAWRGADMLSPTMIVNAVRQEGVQRIGPTIPSGAQVA
jgi:methylmalonyl-CoA mutase cobalamin-binding subunit